MTAKNTISPPTCVGLLRGINVGGKHILPMKQLAEFFTQENCGNVRTYIQSGNVVFSASPATLAKLADRISKRIEQRFGFPSPLILRRPEEIAQVVRDNPFLHAGLPEKTLHVYFLAGEPSTDAVKNLDPDRSAPDAYHVRGREIYLYLPNGMARTKLTSAYFDSKLSTVCTARNWATVLKLLEMTQAS
ncbi:MAG: DUF1697 domain-containing protein [Candidatus Korobacteraceae bacterium]